MSWRQSFATAAALVLAACTSGQSGGDVAPAEALTDCQGAWVVEVRNQTYEVVEVFYTRGNIGTRQRAGEVDPQDTKLLFFRSDPFPDVWAIHEGVRIMLTDRTAQTRAKVYLALGCDTR